jgi:hypothetical protein
MAPLSFLCTVRRTNYPQMDKVSGILLYFRQLLECIYEKRPSIRKFIAIN